MCIQRLLQMECEDHLQRLLHSRSCRNSHNTCPNFWWESVTSMSKCLQSVCSSLFISACFLVVVTGLILTSTPVLWCLLTCFACIWAPHSASQWRWGETQSLKNHHPLVQTANTELWLWFSSLLLPLTLDLVLYPFCVNKTCGEERDAQNCLQSLR